MRAAVYTRISSDPSGQRLGVQRQEEECRALCEAKHWKVAAVFEDDDRSAYSGKRRPQYEAMLEAVRAGQVNAIVAWHPDRLHRSPRELEDFIDLVEQHKVKVATVQSGEYDLATASGRMTARVVGAVARGESEHKSERAKAKHRQLAKAGKNGTGGYRPFGYRYDRLGLVPAEAELIREAVARFLAGDTIRGICADWTQRGITTSKGKKWSPFTLRRTIASARIAGWREHRGELVTEAEWPAIISLDDLLAVRAILADPARLKNRTGRRYLLTGLLYCSDCGAKLVARPRDDKRKCYVCATGPGFNGCGRRRTLAEPVDGMVVAAIQEALRTVNLDHRSTPDDDGALEEIADIETRLDELAKLYAVGQIGQREWLTARSTLDERLSALRTAETVTVLRHAALADAKALQALDITWDDLTIQRQRDLVAELIERVELGPAVKGRNFFDPSRVHIVWRA